MYSAMSTLPSPLLPIITIILCFAPSISAADHPPPYLYPSTFSTDYQTMLSTFKIFPYTLPLINHTTTFHSSLLSSTFITTDPTEAHLFYLPTPPDIRTRSLERVISLVRSSFPFWNRSLAADHFFLSSCSLSSAPAAPSSSARNVVELRKNAVRVSCFPAPKGNYFIPHKDVSLPPPSLTRSPLDPTRPGQNYKHLAYFKTTSATTTGAELIEELKADPEFKVELSRPLDDEDAYVDTLKSSKFCLFVYGGAGEVAGLGDALTCGCVPVVITDRPIQDMPLMDVVRWQEIALFVGSGVGPAGLKRTLNEVVGGGKYERMKRSGVAAAHHFVWNEPPKPYDAFHMVVYQLWMRRHVVRYATSDRR